MSDRYPFMGDKTLITHDGAVVWSEQVAVQSSLNFSNVSDSTLTDSINDSYATAVEDNETQYLSVLETSSDITLEDLHNLTLGNPKMGAQETLQLSNEDALGSLDVNAIDVGDQQVIVFSVDGSDDLYGIQFTQDDQGNVQKYQFKFRTTDDGQLEAIPESIQLLSDDEEADQIYENDQVLFQEIEAEEAENQETSVFLQEPEVQETQVYIEQEEEAIEEPIQLEQEEEDVRVYIKGEEVDGHSEDNHEYTETQEELENHEELLYEETETEVPQEDDYEEDTIDVKAGILEETLTMRNGSNEPTNIKQEFLHEESRDATFGKPEPPDYHTYHTHHEETGEIHYEENGHNVREGNISKTDVDQHIEDHIDGSYNSAGNGIHEAVLEYEHYVTEDIHPVYEESNTTDSQSLQHEEHYEHLFIQEKHVSADDEKSRDVQLEEEVDEQFVTETGTEIDSDNDEYQIVEGMHITAEGDIGEDASSSPFQEPETILQEVIEKPPPAVERAKILRQAPLCKNTKDTKTKNNKTLVYYVVPHVEKENVNSLPVNNGTTFRPIRSNPRSILKSSFPVVKEELDVKNLTDERMNKRFARSKEAVQARLFNNFISKTTILHAPVRQTRLPRKQEIKPVDNRRDEEIIVQEVMVSSKGFVDVDAFNVEERLRNKDKLEVTGYVVLSDSDDDYDPKQGNKKKKRYKKHKKVDATDSDDSDISVIEIPSDEEEEATATIREKGNTKRGRGRPRKSADVREKTDAVKRRRGRPPKSGADMDESPQKKSRTESDEFDSDNTKKEINCPHCTKTFPNQNSLSTHIQHHNLENSLRNSQANKAGVSRMSMTLEYKHKCDACGTTFKNNILLKRHVCEKQPQKIKTRLECTLCKKTYPDVHTLNVHKRIHIKENLVNTTSVEKVSPKKLLTRASTIKPRSPTRISSTLTTYKCKECSRVCYSQESLNLHEKTHRKFTCKTCKLTFASRLLLDTHIRINCVKPPSPANRRLSFKIRKSFVQSPRRKSGRFSRSALPKHNLAIPAMSTSSNSSLLDINVDCEICKETFPTFQDKFKHRVKVHGLETPDKSILAEQKKLLHKPKIIHAGIPARDGMRQVITNMKTKISLVSPTKKPK